MTALTQLKLAGTGSFRLASSKLFDYGCNCLSGDTEIRTPTGWQRLDSLGPTCTALCWEPSGALSYRECTTVIAPNSAPLHEFYGWNHTLLYTDKHRIPYRVDRSNNHAVLHPAGLIGKTYTLPVSGQLPATAAQTLKPLEAALLVMIQADFSKEGNRWRGSFVKHHKIKRFHDIVTGLGLTWSPQQHPEPGGFRASVVIPAYLDAYIDSSTKNFNESLIAAQPLAIRRAFLFELGMWDGEYRGKSIRYCNTNWHNIQVCQFLAHISGWRSAWSVNLDNNRGYGRGENLPLYTLNIKQCDYILTKTLRHSLVPGPALVYCLTTPTGFFMTRRNGIIQVTGNSQNADKSVLDIVCAPPGWSIVQVDQAGAEALVVAYLTRPGRYRNLFLNGVKAHTYVALQLFLDKFRGEHPRERYWLVDPAVLRQYPEFKKLAELIKHSKFEYDIGKRTGHSSNYRMGPNTFREQCLKESEGTLILDVEQARYFLDTYKQLFPEIVEWQNEIEAQIRSTRTLRNLFGFPRRFERHITDGYIREAISWIPQSTVGCITHRAYREVYDRATSTGRVWRLFNNKHDSFAMLVPDSDIECAAHCMSRALNQELVGRDGEVFRMKSEVQVGKNWGKFDPKHNPLGMKDYVLTE